MGVERLRAFLRRHSVIGLDSSVFIYQLEANSRYVALTDLVFRWLERPDSLAVTSAITMTEVLVPAYRTGDEQHVYEFQSLLSVYPNLEWVAADLEIADIGARLRAAHRLRTPDALQAASAIRRAATGFISNDAAFDRVGAFESLTLDALL